MAVDTREEDIIFMTTAITWMEHAFQGRSVEVAQMVTKLGPTFARLLQSSESEIECLKRALPADKPIQTVSLPVPVDSAEE